MPWVTFLPEVEYFNGITPVPQIGIISLHPEYFEFIPGPGDDTGATRRGGKKNKKTDAIEIYYDKIVRLEKFDDVCFVIIQDTKNESRKFVLRDKETIEIIEERHVQKLPRLQKIVHLVHSLPAKKLIPAVLIIVPLVSYFIFFGFTHLYKIIPLAYDQKIGERSYNFIRENSRVCENPKGMRSLERLKSKLTTNTNIHISVIDEDVVNALAFPGGRIILFNGLLNEAGSPEEIYAILAHEVAHEEKRHSIQQMTRTMGAMFISSLVIGGAIEGIETLEKISEVVNVIVFMKYSRGFEEEADLLAVEQLMSQKISLKGFVDFFERNSRATAKANIPGYLEWLSTHPLDQKRIDLINASIKTNKYSPRPVMSKNDWVQLKNICK